MWKEICLQEDLLGCEAKPLCPVRGSFDVCSAGLANGLVFLSSNQIILRRAFGLTKMSTFVICQHPWLLKQSFRVYLEDAILTWTPNDDVIILLFNHIHIKH